MPQIKTSPDDPASMAERINKRLANSGRGAGTNPDVTVQTGDSARRTFSNLHHSSGVSTPPNNRGRDPGEGWKR